MYYMSIVAVPVSHAFSYALSPILNDSGEKRECESWRHFMCVSVNAEKEVKDREESMIRIGIHVGRNRWERYDRNWAIFTTRTLFSVFSAPLLHQPRIFAARSAPSWPNQVFSRSLLSLSLSRFLYPVLINLPPRVKSTFFFGGGWRKKNAIVPCVFNIVRSCSPSSYSMNI